MELVIEKDIRETSNKKAGFELTGIPSSATHLRFKGDLDFAFSKENSLKISGEFMELLARPAFSVEGHILLALGDGLKYITVEPFYVSATKLKQGISSVIPGPPDEFRFLPGNQFLVSSEAVGSEIRTSSSVYAKILSVKEIAGVRHYILDKDLGISPADEYWIESTFTVGEECRDTISLVEDPDDPVVFPEGVVDTSEYWSSVLSFYRELSGEDKLLVEGIWSGISQNWGNLMQRLYELDAQQSIFDMFIYRRKSWAHIDASLRKHVGTGYTDRSKPSRFMDTGRVFVSSVFERDDVDNTDTGKFLTVGGKSYEIDYIVNPSEVSLKGARFETAKNLSYDVGGQYVADSVVRTKEVVLDSELTADLGIKDMFFAKCKDMPNGGRVRYDHSNFSGGYTKSSDPENLYWTNPIFGHQHKGTRVKVNGATYRVTGFSSDGYRIELQGAAFSDAENISFKFLDTDFSFFEDLSLTVGSAVVVETSGEGPFLESDVGCFVIIQSGANRGIHKIVRFIDASSVEIDHVATATESSIVCQIPADVVVNLDEGEVRRTSYSRYTDCSTANIECGVKVKYRVKADPRLVSASSLQEWLETPQSEVYTEEHVVVGGDNYVGHRNISELRLVNPQGISLMHGEEYSADLKEGTFTAIKGISEKDRLHAEIVFNPWWGYPDSEFFLEAKGKDKFIYFRDNPRVNLFAETAFYNHEDPYKEYGHLIDFYQENNEAYYFGLMAVWIAHWMGPRPEYKARALNILLGLPFAEDSGTVSSLSERKVGTARRWVITIDYDNIGTEQVLLPPDLDPYVGIGEKIDKFSILSGFSTSYPNAGTLRGRSVLDTDGKPFIQSHVDGKIWIENGKSKGVYRTIKYVEPSQITVKGDLEEESDVSFKILVPAIRVFDKVNHPGFLQSYSSPDILNKYYTQNTTPTEKAIAQRIMEENLFMVHIPTDAMSGINPQNISIVNDFLKNTKAVYTDFIFQIFNDFDDSFELGEGDELYPDFELDLTSTFGWFSGTLPPVYCPVTNKLDPHGHPGYINGESVSPFMFEDKENAPFTVDHIGSNLVVPGKWRFHNKGSVSPAKPKNLFSASPDTVFAAEDVGKDVFIQSVGGVDKYGTIVTVLSPQEVVLRGAVFDSLQVDLLFQVANEKNQGVYTVSSFIDSTRVTLDKAMNPGSGIFYQLIDEDYQLDDETLNLYSECFVDRFDSSSVWIDRQDF